MVSDMEKWSPPSMDAINSGSAIGAWLTFKMDDVDEK